MLVPIDLHGNSQSHSKWIIGIDEAGRGSLVGELMVCSYAVKKGDITKLLDIGVRDSKQLTPFARQKLYYKLIEIGLFSIYAIKPRDLDKKNINLLEEKAALADIKNLLKSIGGVNYVEEIIIDKFGELRFLKKILSELGFKGRLIVEEKADSRYAVVSAASIIAKVIRDRRVEVLKKIYGIKGSGYPSDPETVESVLLLLENGNTPDVIRYSWATLQGTKFYKKKRKSLSKSLDEFMK